jgi:hypothetical protein
MIIIVLILLEIAVFFVVGVLYVVKFIHFWRKGIKVKQPVLRQYGHVVALVGMAIGMGLPNVLGIQNEFNDTGNTIYFLVTTAGASLLLIGWRFIVASYKTEEETPDWINNIMKLSR